MKYLMPSQLFAPLNKSNRCYQSHHRFIRHFFHRGNSDSSFVRRQPQSLRTVVSTTAANINIRALHNCRASFTSATAKKYVNNDTISSIPLRSVLYVPASNSRALDKVTKLLSFSSSSDVTERATRPDAIMYDFEDGVHPTKKKEARIQLYEYLQQQSSTASATTSSRNYFGLLRINRFDTPWFHDDASLALSMVLDTTINIHGVVLPKIEGWEDVDFVARHFRSLMSTTTSSSSVVGGDDDGESESTGSVVSPVPLWPMIETPRAILSASEIACQTSIQGLILGTNDLSKELRLRPTTTPSSSSTISSSTPRM